MAKTVAYYISYRFGDGSLLDELIEQYGFTFEKMSKREKFLLIQSLATEQGDSLQELPRDEIYQLQEKLKTRLSQAEKTEMIETLIDQIRCGKNLVVTKSKPSGKTTKKTA